MNYKSISAAIFMLFILQNTLAQKSISFAAGYQYMQASEWEKTIQTYNFARPWLAKKQPSLRHGFGLVTSVAFELKPEILLSPTLSFQQFSSVSNNFNERYAIKVYFIGLGLNIGYYPFKQKTHAARNLFLELSPAFSLLTTRVHEGEEVVEIDEDKKYRPSKFLFNLGWAVGYDFELSTKFTLSPNARVTWYPQAELDDFAEAVHGTAQPNLQNENAVWIFSANMTLTYLFGR